MSLKFSGFHGRFCTKVLVLTTLRITDLLDISRNCAASVFRVTEFCLGRCWLLRQRVYPNYRNITYFLTRCESTEEHILLQNHQYSDDSYDSKGMQK